MVRLFRIALVSAFCLAAQFAQSKAKTDTLYSAAGDRVVIRYEIQRSGDAVKVQFDRPKKMLGKANAGKYRKLDRLALVFFDRIGGYDEIQFVGDEMPKAFMKPHNVSFSSSEEGYYFFYDSDSPPVLSMTMIDSEGFRLQVPLYLAYQENKRKFRLIAYCGDLLIEDSRKPAPIQDGGQTLSMKQNSVTVEVEADNGEMTKVLDCIHNIERVLPLQKSYPLSEGLEDDIRLLRKWQYDIKDGNLKRRVAETLDAYEQKKQDLIHEAEMLRQEEARNQQQEAERLEREQKKEQEALREAQQQEQEKSRKRTVWMTIGGILLAILAFVGNQVMQNLRSRKSQMSVIQMQTDIARRAEQEAKRRAQSAIRSQTRKVVNIGEQKAKDAVKKVGKNVSKKNKTKKFSI